MKYRSYDHLDLPTLQQIHELRGERVHFLVPLGEHPPSLLTFDVPSRFNSSLFRSPHSCSCITTRKVTRRGSRKPESRLPKSPSWIGGTSLRCEPSPTHPRSSSLFLRQPNILAVRDPRPHTVGTARPTRVSAGRGIVDIRTSLWGGWVVEQALPDTLGGGSRASIYFAGYDTLFFHVDSLFSATIQ